LARKITPDPLAEKFSEPVVRKGSTIHYRRLASEVILATLPRVVWKAFHYDSIFNGRMVVSEKSLHLLHNLGIFFTPNLNSTAFLNETRTLIARGQLQRVVGYVRKTTTRNGVEVPILKKIYLYASPDAVLPAGCNGDRSSISRAKKPSRVITHKSGIDASKVSEVRPGSLREKLMSIIPNCVPGNMFVDESVPGTTIHCANHLSIDNSDKKRMNVISASLHRLHQDGKVGCVKRIMMTPRGPHIRNVFYSGRPSDQIRFTDVQLREAINNLKTR
jgi:hypothetical protein